MVVIIVDTGNFEFIGLGDTQEQAHNGLLARWGEHCKAVCDADSGYMQELIDGGSARVIELAPGQAVIYGVDS